MSLLFIFDMDDVLYDYDWRTRMAGLTEHTGHSLLELRRRWWHETGEMAAEAGTPSTGAEYLAAATAAIGADIPREEWVRIRAEATHAWPGSIAAVARAAELGQVTLLTNNGALVGEHLPEVAPELVPIMGAEHMFATAHYGARKPDPIVFERVLEKYETDARLAFFADDRLENVRGAQSVGITAHHVVETDPDLIASELLAAIEDFAHASVAA